ncbi:hypothetical protein C3L33_07273, partial [Rhododendron williamsianum]
MPAVEFNTAAKKRLLLNARSNKRGKKSKLMNPRRTSKRRIFMGIHNGREGEEPLEGHASSSSPTGNVTGTERPDISNVEEPEEESETEEESEPDWWPMFPGPANQVLGKMGIFLFEVLLFPRDVEQDRLLIPVEAALEYFTPLANRQETYKLKIEITDHQKSHWHMTVTYEPSECSFVVENKWKRFVAWNRLEIMDVLRFYKTVPISYDFHYLVELVKRRSPLIIPEFKLENFMFQLPLTDRDIRFQRLFISAEDVHKHWPKVGVPADTHYFERLYFSDDLNAALWGIKIAYEIDSYRLMLADYFTKHNLEKGDMIRFYRPVHPLHSRHFLIEYEKGVGNQTQSEIVATDDTMDRGSDGQGDGVRGGTDRGSNRDGNPTQSETATTDDTMDRGSDGQGDAGRRTHSRGRKWWKFGCCMAMKSNARTEES